MYKMLNDLTPKYMTDLIPTLVQTATPYRLRNQANYRVPHCRTSLLNRSFIPATLRQWNSLELQIRHTKTLSTFKSKLKFKANSMCKLYSLSFGPCPRYLTQLRLGLSKLNSHLFKIGVAPSPNCRHCQNSAPETISHFLLVCPAYAAQRHEMLHSLRDDLPQGVTLHQSKCTNLLIYGSVNLSPDQNMKFLTATSKFIYNTKRFLVSH